MLPIAIFHLSLVVKCPAIKVPANGIVYPSQCKNVLGVQYGTECFFECSATLGYRVEGMQNISCREDGFWSANASDIICKGRHLVKYFTGVCVVMVCTR